MDVAVDSAQNHANLKRMRKLALMCISIRLDSGFSIFNCTWRSCKQACHLMYGLLICAVWSTHHIINLLESIHVLQ